jgi:triosephosphate isomerase (TIM)
MTPEAVERRPAIVGNWKLWGTRVQAETYCDDLLRLLPDPTRRVPTVGIAAPFTALDVCVTGLGANDVGVYAQNMHQAETGAFTGEVSAPMLVELGVDGVVLGHSERRQYFGETDRALQEKVPAALAAGLEPILCVGETEEEREAGDTELILRFQVESLRDAVGVHARLVIAYEPVWAIGTGRNATGRDASAMADAIRSSLDDLGWGDLGASLPILYGGSVSSTNVAEILAEPSIDGALVGGASLKPDEMAGIVARAGITARARGLAG